MRPTHPEWGKDAAIYQVLVVLTLSAEPQRPALPGLDDTARTAWVGAGPAAAADLEELPLPARGRWVLLVA